MGKSAQKGENKNKFLKFKSIYFNNHSFYFFIES